jgi:pentapeptide MXKDX repeat protein
VYFTICFGRKALAVKGEVLYAMRVDAMRFDAMRVDEMLVDAMLVDAMRVDAMLVDAVRVDAVLVWMRVTANARGEVESVR